jgi:hypothetical protein
MSHRVATALVAAGALAIAACGSTSFKSTWSAPDAGQLKIEDGTKILAMVVSPNEAKRRGMEAALVSELKEHGIDGIPAYSVVPADAGHDAEAAAPYVKKSGAAYALVVQITGKSKEITGTPSMMGMGMYGAPRGFYGGGFGGWGGYGWGGGGTDIRTDTIVGVQTLLYDLSKNELVWAGQSETMNPSKAESFMRDLLKAVGNELQKAGLIGPAK